MRSIRYVLTVTLLIYCWNTAVFAWQTVPGDSKTLSKQLAALAKDSLLTDSSRNARIHALVTAYTTLIEKSRPLPPARGDSTKRKIDTVYLTRSTDKIVIYTDSAQVALLKQDIEAHAWKGTNTFLYVLLFFLLALGAAGCWFLIRALEKIDAVRSVLTGTGIAQPPFQPAIQPVDPPAETPPPVISPVYPPTETSRNSFVAEIMMTAGPRKKLMSAPDADKDLGEDVCGFVMKAETVGMWLLDGTSDLHCLRDPASGLEYFSSRLLAQHIGNALRKSFATEEDHPESLNAMMEKAIAVVKQEWLRTIANLPEPEKSFLKKNIRNKNLPQCASTLLSARLYLDGRLEAYRSGDSKMLLFREGPQRLMPDEPSFTTKNGAANDRIFFTLDLDEKNELDIVYRDPRHELLHKEDIRDLIAFSDGIGPLTEHTLQKEFDQDREAARRRIITETQGTEDDKSICLIQIRNNR